MKSILSRTMANGVGSAGRSTFWQGALALGALALGALALGALAFGGNARAAICGAEYGHVTGSDAVDVTDVTCLLHASLATLGGEAAPECLTQGMDGADLNCDGLVNGTDAAIAVALALGEALGPAVDGDGDGCVDYCQGLLPCQALSVIECGATVQVNTVGGPSEWSTYSCFAAWDESGPEARYLLDLPADAEVVAALSGIEEGQDLDVFILGAGCSPTDCLAGGDNQASAVLAGGMKYLVVVDGHKGAAGTTTLSITCDLPCLLDDPCEGVQCGAVQCGDQTVQCGTCPAGQTCTPNNECVEFAGPSCAGFCGVQSSDGCWCDDMCFGFGDCCEDVCGWCAAEFPNDCAPEACGDGVCDAGAGETCANCAIDCACEGDETCAAGACLVLVPGTCADQCGLDEVQLGDCYCDQACFGFGDCCEDVCAACATTFPDQCGPGEQCGDGVCEVAAGETYFNCPEDCAGPEDCGDGVCDAVGGETCASCPEDCGCEAGLVCVAGQCAEPNPCGDGMCDPETGENEETCPEDCATYQGECCVSNGSPGCVSAACVACVCPLDPFCCDTSWDGLCAGAATGECASSCPCGDVPEDCGDGVCDEAAGETCSSCPADCACAGGDVCQEGQCVPPVVGSCETAACGSNAPQPGPCYCDASCFGLGDCCADVCAWCAAALGAPCEAPESCGDGACSPELGETEWNCPADCLGAAPPACGNGICEPALGEDAETCPADCLEVSSCCVDQMGAVGCDSAPCEDCVCAADPFCCESGWDDICAELAAPASACGGVCPCGGTLESCGDGACDAEQGEDCASCPADCGCEAPLECQAGACGEPEPCGDGVCDPELGEDEETCPQDCAAFEGGCCAANDTPGCESAPCTACICAADPFCCATQWDGICADAASAPGGECEGICNCQPPAPECGDGQCDAEIGEDEETCPEDCATPSYDGACCEPNATPGCELPACWACVCPSDEFCCNTQWDDLCSTAATEPPCAAECECSAP